MYQFNSFTCTKLNISFDMIKTTASFLQINELVKLEYEDPQEGTSYVLSSVNDSIHISSFSER